jgi:hypothetical protein
VLVVAITLFRRTLAFDSYVAVIQINPLCYITLL